MSGDNPEDHQEKSKLPNLPLTQILKSGPVWLGQSRIMIRIVPPNENWLFQYYHGTGVAKSPSVAKWPRKAQQHYQQP